MTAMDHLLIRGESDPSMRSATVAVYILEAPPAWRRLVETFERASREFVRLRQRVVEPSLPLTDARWVTDPDFDLSYHLRRLRVPEPGDIRDLLLLVEGQLMSPLDIARPLWDAILVEGFEDGSAALIHRTSHALTDGVGGVRLMRVLFDGDADAPVRSMPAVPVPEDLTPADLTAAATRRLPAVAVRTLVSAAARTGGVATRAARHPGRTAEELRAFAASLARILAPVAPPSPLLSGRSMSRRVLWSEVSLYELKRAAKAGGGSLNDAYLAALAGGLRRYHEKLGVPVEVLSLACPINRRVPGSEAGGNHWSAATIRLPVGEPDPRARMRDIGAAVGAARSEVALDSPMALAPLLDRMPDRVVEAVTRSIPRPDIQASNIPGQTSDLYVAGKRVTKFMGFGPLPGVAMMVVLVSHLDSCAITVHYDPAALTEPALFEQCLQEGFDEVLAVAADPGGRAVGRTSKARAKR